MAAVFFWVITQRLEVISHRVFRCNISLPSAGYFFILGHLNMGPISIPETSVINNTTRCVMTRNIADIMISTRAIRSCFTDAPKMEHD